MTEKQFLALYKERRNLKSIREAKDIFDNFWTALFAGLEKDGKIIMKDWGVFELKIQKPKKIFDFISKDMTETEEKKVIKFRPLGKLLERVENLKVGE